MEIEITVMPAGRHPALEAYAVVHSAVVPREPVTAEEVERLRLRRPGDVRLLARVDSHVAGCAGAIPSDLPGRTFAAVAVLPEFRRRGIGRAFLERIAAVARERGSGIVSAATEEGDEAAAAFASRFGFAALFREIEVARALCEEEDEGPAPPGIEIVPVTSRAGLLAGAYALASQALPEMPLPEPYLVPPYEQWVEDDATGPGVLAEASLVALDGGRVVGFAGLLRRAADPGLAENGLTAVAPSHRGRGIATALKRRQIAWAARHGYREIVTWTQEGNEAMQAVNRKLGYVARPAWIRLEAPLDKVEAHLGRRT